MPSLSPQYIQFPICNAQNQFTSKRGWFEAAVSDEVERSQPYHLTPPTEHPLAALRELVNTDKHRSLVIAEYAVASFEVAPSAGYEIVDTWVQDNPLQVGMTACEIHCRLTKAVRKPKAVKFAAEVAYGEQIEIPNTGRSWNMLGTLKLIIRQIGPLLDRLEAAGC